MQTRFKIVSNMLLLAVCVCLCRAYNPQPSPPSLGRYPVGYDPVNRSRPYSNGPMSRLDVIRQRRSWQPPRGYCPLTRRKKMALREASFNPDLADKEDLEYVEWENESSLEDKESVCTGIWVGNRILYKTCVVLKK